MNKKLLYSIVFFAISATIFSLTFNNFIANDGINQSAATKKSLRDTPIFNDINIGEKVIAKERINIHETAGGPVSGIMAKGTTGKVIGKETVVKKNRRGEITSSVFWIQVAFDLAGQGWSKASNFNRVASTKNSPLPLDVDNIPPSTPVIIDNSVTSYITGLTFSWTPSTDNNAIAGYNIFRNGVKVGIADNTTPSDALIIPKYYDTGLDPDSSYTYTIQAFDANGNVSGISAPKTFSTTKKSVNETPPLPLFIDATVRLKQSIVNGDTDPTLTVLPAGRIGTLIEGPTASGISTSPYVWSVTFSDSDNETLKEQCFSSYKLPCTEVYNSRNWFLASKDIDVQTFDISESNIEVINKVIVTKTGNGTITSTPSGIDCGSTCSSHFPSSASITLTASPSSGYTFSGWSGACSGTGSCNVSAGQERSVNVNFTEQTATNPLTDIIFATGENYCTYYRDGTRGVDIGNPLSILNKLNTESDEERLDLEYVNRARMNPTLSATIMRDTTDSNVLSSYQTWGVNRSVLFNELSAYPPVEPLAMNDQLRAVAMKQACDQFINGFQGHGGSDGSNTTSRITSVGYIFTAAGENQSAFGLSPFHAHASFEVDWGGGANGIQTPPGHRINIHNGNYKEAGIAIPLGTMRAPFTDRLTSEEYATRNGLTPYITGVAYFDFNGNNFYDLGEGIGGIKISTTDSVKGNISTVTERSGGYKLSVSNNGNYSVTFSSDNPGVIIPSGNTQNVAVAGGQNSKLDYRPVYTTPIITGPNTLTSGSAGTFNFTPIPFATAYEYEVSTVGIPALDGAESISTSHLIAKGANGLSPTYNIVATDVKASGNSSYHLVTPQIPPPQDYFLSFTKPFAIKSNSTISFKSCLGWATVNQIFRVQVSENNSSTWTNIFSQAGTEGSGQYTNGNCSFTSRNLSLSSYAGKNINIRFIYNHIGGSYYYQIYKGMGLYLDDIQVLNADEYLDSRVTTLGNIRAFNFSSNTPGQALIRVRGTIGTRKYPYSATKTVIIN